MNRHAIANSFPVIITLLLIALCFPRLGHSQEGDIVLIANPANSKSALTKDEIKDIYLGNSKYWENNVRMIPLVMTLDDQRTVIFFTKIINATPRRYKYIWKEKELAGKGIEPKILSSVQEIVEDVAKNKGAIGYLFKSDLTDEIKAKVKIITY